MLQLSPYQRFTDLEELSLCSTQLHDPDITLLEQHLQLRTLDNVSNNLISLLWSFFGQFDSRCF